MLAGMPKRLIITLDYPPQTGGIASYVLNVAAHLNPAQTILYAPKAEGDREFDAQNPWKVYRLNPYLSFIWPRWLALLYHVFVIVRLEKITELHVHQALPVGYVAYILKKIKKIPYTVFLHGTDVEYAMRPTKRRKFAKICRAADRIIFNSQFLKLKLESRIDNLPRSTVVYPCPGDFFYAAAPEFEVEKNRRELGLGGKRVLLTVSRMVEGKGLPHLVTAVGDLIKKIPSLVWVVVGVGPKLASIEKLVQQRGLQSFVRFIGDIPYERLPALYQTADVFALLTHPDTEAEEGWGTVFLEAAASGLPVVAGAAGGALEAVEQGVTGFVVNVYERDKVAEALFFLLTDQAAAVSMGQRARARAFRSFRWAAEVEKIL